MTPQRGVTLVEVLVTVVLVSFGVLALAKYQMTLHGNQAVLKNRTEAQMYAREGLDELASTDLPGAVADWTETRGTDNATYTRTVDVTVNPVGDVTVSSEVRWSDSRGLATRTRLASHVAAHVSANEAKLVAALTSLATGNPPSAPPWTPVPPTTPTPPLPDPNTPPVAGDPPAPPVTPPSPTPVPPGLGVPSPNATRIITGSIVLVGRAELRHVSINGTGEANCSLNATAYSCTVPNGWSGSITVTSTGGQRVSPASQSFSGVTANRTGATFIIRK